jgi:hypothetical protein
MFKVSFKDNFKKVSTFNNKIVVVTLTGKMKLPSWFFVLLPSEIQDWYSEHPSVEVDCNYNKEGCWEMTITTYGKAKCNETDEFNPVVGMRIAESRAKLSIYKFMHTLSSKLIGYYQSILYGEEGYRAKAFTSESLREVQNKYVRLAMLETNHIANLLENL